MVHMSNLRAAQRAMTRQLLMTTALELFENKGYAATTVDDIATAAGTTRATFYAYFPSRSELMKALIDERLNEELQRSRSAERGLAAVGVPLRDSAGGTVAALKAASTAISRRL